MTFEGVCLHVIIEYEGRIVNFFIKEEEEKSIQYHTENMEWGRDVQNHAAIDLVSPSCSNLNFLMSP